MAKQKTEYVCSECGYRAAKWVGQCPSCKAWSTLNEEQAIPSATKKILTSSNKAILLHEIEFKRESRIDTQINEFNRVLGGGIVPGSLILIGGEPGIGKSTLALQAALSIPQGIVLYVSGEESAQQIRMRAERLQAKNQSVYILPETRLHNIIEHAKELRPALMVIDSIQTMFSENLESTPGTVSQIRECTNELMTFAKTSNVPIILVGHITKEGTIAGPKILEHMVDTVLQFEGDRNYVYRILRSVKNRFGSTSEIGIFEMQQSGLRQVTNPSEMLISAGNNALSGVAVAASLEGARPLLIETQALVSTAAFGTPQRSATGFDSRRLNMLLAVLEKRMGFRLAQKDVFLNIAGGIRVEDPAIDLAITAAVFSSDLDIVIPKEVCFAGEIGLSGEIRAVQRIEQRVAEAQKLGFRKMFVPELARKQFNAYKGDIELIFVDKIEEVLRTLFGRK
ncbi:MAG: hypothetical protein RIS47_780 [Bacteroidota bacterium]|jgi:DNA repair protein RadA/Sms